MTTISERMARDRLKKTPRLDERKDCAACGRPFRCPTAQDQRFVCGPCMPIPISLRHTEIRPPF